MRTWSGYRALHSPKGCGVKRFKCRYIVLPVNVSDRQDASPQGGGGGGGKKILGWGVLTALQKRKQRTSKEGKFCTGRNNRRRQRQRTLVTLKEGQRVFSTVTQVGIKMSTQKHQGVCAQRRTESRLSLCGWIKRSAYMHEHTCRGLSGYVSGPAPHSDHADRLHIRSLALKNWYGCKSFNTMRCSFKNTPFKRRLFHFAFSFISRGGIKLQLQIAVQQFPTEIDRNEFRLAKVWRLEY